MRSKLTHDQLGGHLLMAQVRPTLEVMVVEAPGHSHRSANEEKGHALLNPM